MHRRYPLLAFLVFSLPLTSCAGERGEPELTANPEALAAFETANDLWATPGITLAQREEVIAGLEQAIELDPEFVMAHAYLAESDAYVHQNWDRSPERAERALRAAQRAVELDPDEPAAHRAMGAYLYRIAKDYPAALESYDRAEELEPGDVATIRMTGYIARRAGRWDDAIERLVRANDIEATPASLLELATTYRAVGRYAEAEQALNRALEMEPDRVATQSAIAWHPFYVNGDLDAIREFLAGQSGGYVGNRWFVAMVDGDYEGALAALQAPGADPLTGQYGINPRSLLAGLAFSRMGDPTQATEAFEQARMTMETMVADRPDDPRTHLALGLALAGLGLKDQAIAAGQRGVDLLPPERDAMIGPHSVAWMVDIHGLAGDAEGAAREIEQLLALPGPWNATTLRLDPWLAGVRDDPAVIAALGGG